MLGARPPSAGKQKSRNKTATPRSTITSVQPHKPTHESAFIESFPDSWDDVEKWILNNSESHKTTEFKTNVREYIRRLKSLIGDVDMMGPDSSDFTVKEEVKELDPLPPSRVSPRFTKPPNTDLKFEDDSVSGLIKRSRGRPRKPSVPGETALSNQQVLTNYFQVQSPPIVDASETNPS